MLTIIKLCKAIVTVKSLITAVRNADILNTEHHGRFHVLYYMNVCFSLQTLKQDVVQVHKEKSQLKSQNQKAETKLQTLSEGVHRLKKSI